MSCRFLRVRRHKTAHGSVTCHFTTRNTELPDAGLIRKDQIYFVDKDKTSGSSSLYSISEFSTTTNENIRKGYLLGKYGATPDLDIEEV